MINAKQTYGQLVKGYNCKRIVAVLEIPHSGEKGSILWAGHVACIREQSKVTLPDHKASYLAVFFDSLRNEDQATANSAPCAFCSEFGNLD